jgi:hypothetical protein
MDTPTANNQAVHAAETSQGPASDTATDPRSAATTHDRSAFPKAPRPRQVRSGAIAAIGAIAVVLAATAVPSRTGSGSASAGYAPIARLAMNALPVAATQRSTGTPVLDLGDTLGTFELPGLPAWNDYGDGTAVLSVWFRSTTIIDAAFAGEIRFSRSVDATYGADEVIALTDPAIVGDAATASFKGTSGYAKIQGELHGRGAYDGVVLRIETKKGAIAHRGIWQTAGGESVQDAILMQFDWIAEGAPVRDVAMPVAGGATLAGKLSPRGSN